MKAVILMVVVSVCVAGARKMNLCQPGRSFLSSDGCNTCFCGPDMRSSGCTRKFCAKPIQKRLYKRDQVCVPGETFKAEDGCNTCTCSQDGKLAACTRRACIKDIPSRNGRSTNEERCTPEESYLHDDGCNLCTCGPSGNKSDSACTMKLCPPQQPPNH